MARFCVGSCGARLLACWATTLASSRRSWTRIAGRGRHGGGHELSRLGLAVEAGPGLIFGEHVAAAMIKSVRRAADGGDVITGRRGSAGDRRDQVPWLWLNGLAGVAGRLVTLADVAVCSTGTPVNAWAPSTSFGRMGGWKRGPGGLAWRNAYDEPAGVVPGRATGSFSVRTSSDR